MQSHIKKTRKSVKIRRPKETKALRYARQHVNELFIEAEKSTDKKLSNRYIQLARIMAMKFRIRLSSEKKRRFCKHCYTYLIPGKNLRVRLHQGKLIYYCFECKKFWRKPINKSK